MTSRDPTASYYDLTLPDGTRTEVWAVLRAVLSPEESLGYVKGCILTRIMRDGRKDTDRQREAEKIGVEAGMLREAMEAHLATPEPMTAALDAVDMAEPPMTATEVERLRRAGFGGGCGAGKTEANPVDAPTEESAMDADEAVLREMAAVINRHSLENASDTPDFLLAAFAREVLSSFARATRSREKWHGNPAARITELEQSLRKVEDALPKSAGLREDYARTHERVADMVADLSIARNRIAELERMCHETLSAVKNLTSPDLDLTSLSAPGTLIDLSAIEPVDSHDPRECAARIGDLEHRLAAQQMSYESQQIDHLDRIAELERERDEARKTAQDLLMESQSWQLRHREAEAERDRWRASFDRAEADLLSLRTTLETERQAAVATAEKLERVRREFADVVDEGQLQRWRDMLQARPSDTLTNAIARVATDARTLRDRYRPRRQSEEPAPLRPVLAWYPDAQSWMPTDGESIAGCVTWTHPPPAPEGK